jgi:hypothetical protein
MSASKAAGTRIPSSVTFNDSSSESDGNRPNIHKQTSPLSSSHTTTREGQKKASLSVRDKVMMRLQLLSSPETSKAAETMTCNDPKKTGLSKVTVKSSSFSPVIIKKVEAFKPVIASNSANDDYFPLPDQLDCTHSSAKEYRTLLGDRSKVMALEAEIQLLKDKIELEKSLAVERIQNVQMKSLEKVKNEENESKKRLQIFENQLMDASSSTTLQLRKQIELDKDDIHASALLLKRAIENYEERKRYLVFRNKVTFH